MGTLKQKLEYIKETKKQIGDAIVAKGGTITDNFRDYATAISNLPSGGGSCTAGVCFDEVGYELSDLNQMKEDLKYTKQKFDEWDPSTTSTRDLYKDDTKLIFAPKINTINVTSMTHMFDGCKSLVYIPLLNTNKVSTMDALFARCESLKTIPLLNTENVVNMRSLFSNCKSLVSIPVLTTNKVEDMRNMFQNSKIRRIPQLDMRSVTMISWMFMDNDELLELPILNTINTTDMVQAFSGCGSLNKIAQISFKSATNVDRIFDAGFWGSPLRYILIKDLGTQSTILNIDFSKLSSLGDEKTSWDVDVTGAKQALVDSLLTYSFDRKTAGYEACTIQLHKNVQPRLTEEQIQQITNKGYILTFA